MKLILSNLLYQRRGTLRTFPLSPHVLLVEDHDIIATVHKNLLSELSCDIDVAANGTQAITLGTTRQYDLILLDIGLSDISGIEVAKTLRFLIKNEYPPLIAVTALSSEETVKTCLGVGINQILIKPVNLNDFKQIFKTIDNYSLNGEPI